MTLYRLLERDLCIFSAPCMVKSILFDVIVEAEQDTEILHIPVDVYRDLMDNSAAVANFTNELMAARFSDVMWAISEILFKSFDKRLAGYLEDEKLNRKSTTIQATHDEIAKELGSAREVVSRMLKYFEKEGIVSLSRGTIQITNEAKLRALAL